VCFPSVTTAEYTRIKAGDTSGNGGAQTSVLP